MTRIPVVAAALLAVWCEPVDPTVSPTEPLQATETPTPTGVTTPMPTVTEPPPSPPLDCPDVQVVPYCDLYPEDC